MKIGFLSPFYYPAMIGGIEWYLFHVTRLLASHGHEVTIYTTNSDGNGATLPRDEKIGGVNVERFPTAFDLTYRLKLWPGLLPALRRADCDILHVFDYAQFHNLAVQLVRGPHSWASAVTIYDIHSEIPRSPARSMPMSLYDKYLAKPSLQGYDRILIRTPYQAGFLRSLGVRHEAIRVTPPGLDPGNFRDPPSEDVQEARDRHGGDAKTMVLYVGRLHRIKGIDVLIRATGRVLSQGHTIQTVIVGPDSDGYGRLLRSLAAELGIEEHVDFAGYVDERQKWLLQSACDIAVLPSSFEGFGQSLIQAMARGKPVIATTRGAMPWVLEDGEAGALVEYGDDEALAGSIVDIATDDRLRRRLSRRGLRRASSFSYPRLVEQLERIYASIGSNTRR
jgi:glycosyltransferase involved in cell wall biosynthesis